MLQYLRCARWLSRLPKVALALAFVTFLHPAGVGWAGTAFAECTEDSIVRADKQITPPAAVPLKDGLALSFRVELVRAWEIRGATLLLHLASGTPPLRLEIGDGRTVPLLVKEGGWLTAELPRNVAAELASGRRKRLTIRAAGSSAEVHTRESHSWIPYLIVDGSTPRSVR